MNIDDIMHYYKSHTKACRDIGLPPQSFYQWRDQGYVSIFSQFAFEEKTNKKLTANLDDYLREMKKRYKEIQKEKKKSG